MQLSWISDDSMCVIYTECEVYKETLNEGNVIIYWCNFILDCHMALTLTHLYDLTFKEN